MIWAIVALVVVLIAAYLVIKGAQLKEIQTQHNLRQERMEAMQENQLMTKQAELGNAPLISHSKADRAFSFLQPSAAQSMMRNASFSSG